MTTMRKFYFKVLPYLSAVFVFFFTTGAYAQNPSFQIGTLNFNGFSSIDNGTALDFGPDGKLYVVEEDGLIKVYTIQRTGLAAYKVTAAQVLNLVQVIPNHNDDDGTLGGPNNRQVTGITVVGTSTNPVMYVSSSDRRRGGGGSGGDANLDTNSGVITRLTWNGTSWIAVDIVRGLPRSEENHATNEMVFVTIGAVDWLLVASGGFTNAGSPSNNFSFTTEYALSGAVLAVNLTQINALPILNDGTRNYVYNLPTLDDPTRANANGITDPNTPGYNGVDVNDPWGGNDGLNMGMLVTGSPVVMFSPGYRNSYDLVVTEDGHVYVTDNGANGGWGGYPLNEGNAATVSNNYRSGEPGSTGADNGEAQVNNKDHLNLVTTDINTYVFGSVYGGHPCPVRANANAGLFTRGSHSPGGAGQAFSDSYFRTKKYDPNGSTANSETNPAKALPANWPPVSASLLNGSNADFRQPTTTPGQNPEGPNDIIVLEWANNTNAVAEYTASNFGGVMQGDLIAGRQTNLHRVDRNSNGDIVALEQNKWTVGGDALGLACQGDNDIFPGTIWVTNYSGDAIKILEPTDFVVCILPGNPGYNPAGDNDSDGYSNDDEVQNGSDPCSGASQPNDFDSDFLSDLLDLDDDADGISDATDPFQLGQPINLPVNNELFLGTNLYGYLGLGFTGLMNNGAANPNYLNWQDKPFASNTDTDDILGGAIGAVTMYQTTGSALNNNQEKGYQFGVNVSTATGPFSIHARMFPPFATFGAGESQALFIGDGFQDNYLKVALGQNSFLSVSGENAGVAFTAIAPTNIGFVGANTTDFDLYFLINPVAGTVQVQYQINSGTIVNFGSPVALQGAVLQAAQLPTNPLAIGIMGTASVTDRFAASWDFIKVRGAAPYVSTDLPNLARKINDPADVINLNSHFDDDGGVAALTYTVTGNTNNAIGAVISGNQLTLTYPGVPASTVITVRATDASNLWKEQSFTVTVTDPPLALFRVNANGPAYVDGNGDTWIADQYFTGGTTYVNNGLAIANTTDDVLYQTERFGNFSYNFPVTNGNFNVQLHFAELYFGAPGGGPAGNGNRVFNVAIEGVAVLTNYDIYADAGAATAIVKSFPVTVSDGTLNIVFTNVANNAKVSAIAILNNNAPVYPALTLNSIGTQFNLLGESPVLFTISGGGNSNETPTYTASGLPTGLSIEPTNGAILGSIGQAANVAGVYNTTITVSKPSSTPVSVSFKWMVTSASAATAVYRVNVGGATVPPADGSALSWEADNLTTPTASLITAPANVYNDGISGAFPGPVIMTNPSISPGVPASVFQSNRNDNVVALPDIKYGFTVPAGKSVEVRLFFAELNGAVNNGGNPRIFDIAVDGTVPPQLTGINMYAVAGAKGGFMRSVTLTSDGLINIDLIRGTSLNPSLNGIEIIVNANTSTLPVEMTYFEANPVSPIEVDLNWGTATEYNHAYFEVEKRYEGTDFETIGSVTSAGNSQEPVDYSFNDDSRMEAINYYRLKSVDIDGAYSYSKTVEVRYADLINQNLKLYPNPASDNLTVEILQSGKTISAIRMVITDASGRTVMNVAPTFTQGRSEISVTTWPAGVYFMNILFEDGNRSMGIFEVK